MTLFIVLVTAMVLAMLSLFAWAIRRNSAGRSGDARRSRQDGDAEIVNAELALLRVQRQELEQDLQTHTVDVRHRDQALLELSEHADVLLQRSQRLRTPGSPEATLHRPILERPLTFALMGLAVPLIAAVLYFRLGTPGAIGQLPTQASSGPGSGAAKVDVKELVARLEQKLNEEPGRAEGWMLLGHTKAKLGDYQGATVAYRKAIVLARKSDELKPVIPDLLSDLAEAVAMQQGGETRGEPAALFGEALQIDPRHQKSLYLAATSAMQDGNNDIARGYWQRLLATLAPDSADRVQVEALITQLSGRPGTAAERSGPDAPSRSVPGTSAVPAGATIAGLVDISAPMRARARPGDTLFVFARRPASATARAGARMPLAVARFTLEGPNGLPKPFLLDDAMAMAPGAKLSDAPEVEIVARLSRSGSAIATAGDLTSEARLVKPVAGTPTKVDITIDRVVP